MLSTLGVRQQNLLKALFKEKKNGLTIDRISENLKITRTAVKQHLGALLELGLVCKGETEGSIGRPCQLYKISEKGENLFPKQYSWFSTLLVQRLYEQLGEDGLKKILAALASDVASSLLERTRNKKGQELLEEVIRIMNELGYEAELKDGKIEATNCVYHDTAKSCSAVCQFDIELLSRLTNSEIDHEECIVRGGHICRFSCHRARRKSTLRLNLEEKLRVFSRNN